MKCFFLVCAAATALTLSGSALATPPTPVTIEVQTVFANGFGTFQTSGAGLCPTGTTTDQTIATGFQSNMRVTFIVLKTFACADGSGTFSAALQVQYVFGAPTDSFTWAIVRGTGAYTNLRGTGSGVGDELPGEVDDHFVGSVHFD